MMNIKYSVWLAGAVVVSSLWIPTAAPATSADAEFLTQTKAAMTKMMTAMDVAPSGDVDRDFVATMVPHHQGAIDMATVELRFGRNQTLRRLAQEIVVTQQEEIVAMRRARAVKP